MKPSSIIAITIARYITIKTVITNFYHLSGTKYCCKPLSKEWKNVPESLIYIETISSLSCLQFERSVVYTQANIAVI